MSLAFMTAAQSPADEAAWGIALSLYLMPVAIVIAVIIHIFFRVIRRPIPTFAIFCLLAANWFLFVSTYPELSWMGSYATEAVYGFATIMILINTVIISFWRSGEIKAKSFAVTFIILALVFVIIGRFLGV